MWLERWVQVAVEQLANALTQQRRRREAVGGAEGPLLGTAPPRKSAMAAVATADAMAAAVAVISLSDVGFVKPKVPLPD